MRKQFIEMPIFNNEEEAAEVMACMWDIIDKYGYVTVADLKKLLRINRNPSDHNFGWENSALSDSSLRNYGKNAWYINLTYPKYLNLSASERNEHVSDDECITASEPNPQPIHITIHTNEISDLSKTLEETFKYIYTIQDRTVNLTIM